MGLWQRIMGKTEIRERPLLADPYFSDFMAMRSSGFATSDAVLSNLAVAARCVALRSEMLASVPLFLFRRRADGGRDRAIDNPLYGVLHDISNTSQSAFEFRELLIRCLDLSGNAYARIESNARGQVVALWPIPPHDVTIEKLASGRLRYRIYNGTKTETLLQDEVLHIRGASRDGIIGLSPIAIARGALSLALSQTDTAAALSRNALRPSGMVSYPQQLNLDQRARVLSDLTNSYAGTSNAGRVLVTDGGAKYEKLAFSPEDAQFLESRKLATKMLRESSGCRQRQSASPTRRPIPTPNRKRGRWCKTRSGHSPAASRRPCSDVC
jgi:HK97 family phage portal protein